MEHDASGAETHVRFIMKVVLVRRCVNKTRSKLKVRESEKEFLADSTLLVLQLQHFFMANLKH